MINFKRYLYVALGGGFGASLRFLLLKVTQDEANFFPYSTIIVNLLGAFLLTFLLNLSFYNLKVNKDFQIAINIGIIGSFTTFSLIMVDIIHLLIKPHFFILYFAITIIGGLIASFIGYYFAHFLNRRGDLL